MQFTSRSTRLAGAAVAISALFALTACAGSSDEPAATSGADDLGTVAGGGLGDVAVRYGYQRYSTIHMVAVIIVIFVIVMLLQGLATMLAKRFAHRSRPSRAEKAAPALRADVVTGA